MDAADIRAAHAADSDWRVAADACVAGLEGAASANLGFVYATDAFAPRFPAIVEHLREATGIAHWVGSVGLGICATGIEYFDEPALCVLAGRFPEDAFRVFPAIVDDLDGFESVHGTWCDTTGARFAVVHGDPRNGRIEALVAALCARMEAGFLVGGLTSSRGGHPQAADDITEGGLSGVMFAPTVPVVTRLTQGCIPLGPRREITRCRGNVLMALDGEPALDAFYKDVGGPPAGDAQWLGSRVFAGLPVRGSDTGDYRVRNLAGIDAENRLLAIAEWVEEGDTVMFCRRDRDAAEQDMRRMLGDIAKALEGPPVGGIYFTCLARGPNLLGEDSEELRLIEEVLGRFPLVGFFGNGEISHDRLYGYTGVLTLFV